MTGLPTSYIYYIDNGRLRMFAHYAEGGGQQLPGEHARVYNIPGGIKIYIVKKSGNKLQHFYLSKYGKNPKFMKEAAELYIKGQLTNDQTMLDQYRKKSQKYKVKTKRKRKK
jgi:hypothetical protein